MKYDVPALNRGCRVIELACKRPGITVTELAEKLDIPKASMNRIIRCLMDSGFIKQDARKKGVTAGNLLTENVFRAYNNMPVVNAALPMLRTLSEKWKTAFALYEFEKPYTLVWRATRNHPEGIKTQPPGFSTTRLNMNAQGQLFMSTLENSEIKNFFENSMAYKATATTIISFKKMMPRIEQIRKNKYAFQEKENNPSMKQYAVPVEFSNITGVFCIGCFLRMEFEKGENLLNDMIYETSIFKRQE
jgi:DNA-binding IclR family transcriptional regulator